MKLQLTELQYTELESRLRTKTLAELNLAAYFSAIVHGAGHPSAQLVSIGLENSQYVMTIQLPENGTDA